MTFDKRWAVRVLVASMAVIIVVLLALHPGYSHVPGAFFALTTTLGMPAGLIAGLVSGSVHRRASD